MKLSIFSRCDAYRLPPASAASCVPASTSRNSSMAGRLPGSLPDRMRSKASRSVRYDSRYLDSSSSSMRFLPARGSAPAPRRLCAARLGVLLDGERVVVVRPLERTLDATAVDEDGGCRLDAQVRTCADVLGDASHGGGIVETGPELRDVEVEVARVAEEAVAVERLLMLEEQVVVLPEPILLAGAL